MCRYKSAIVLQNGDLIHAPETDSHEHLVAWAGLDDTTRQPNFVRVEYAPVQEADLIDIDKYSLRVDQDWTPAWWDETARGEATRKLREVCAKAIITDGTRNMLIGGVYVLGGTAVVGRLISGRIVAMGDSSQVGEMWDASQVGAMWGSSRVGTMAGSSQVGEMWDASQVGAMWGSSRVGEMWGSSRVDVMKSSSRVDAMRGSSQAPRPPQTDRLAK